MLVRAIVDRAGPNPDKAYPGDLIAGGETLNGGAITTVGGGTLSGTAIATGIIYRSGPTGAYTDGFDTANNIISALSNNPQGPEIVPGSSFRLLVINSVAFLNTITFGTGIIQGAGTMNVAASTWREYLVTILNAQLVNITQATVTNASNSVSFNFSGTQSAYNMGSSGGLYNRMFTIGASVTGTGIPAGTTVSGLLLNGNGVYGVLLSANATASGINVALTFGPTVQIDSLRSGTL